MPLDLDTLLDLLPEFDFNELAVVTLAVEVVELVLELIFMLLFPPPTLLLLRMRSCCCKEEVRLLRVGDGASIPEIIGNNEGTEWLSLSCDWDRCC